MRPTLHAFPKLTAVAVALQLLWQTPALSAEDVNARQSDGSTALQWAVYRRDTAEVERLIRAGADVKIANNFGATPMSLAAATGDADVIRLLLEAGADPDSPNADGQTALMAVARTGHVAAAELLVKAGARVNAVENWGGQTALMWAAARRQPEMVRFLVKHRADVNARSIVRDWQRKVTSEPREKDMDRGGFTPLLYAAREGCAACVKELLAAKADIDLPDPRGTTPLVIAIMNMQFDTAKLLMESGADIQLWDFSGMTPLYTAVDVSSVPADFRPDTPSTDRTTSLDIIKLLIERGANVNAQLKLPLPARTPAAAGGRADKRLQNIGATPLLRASLGADLEVMKLLIEHGALVELPLADGTTPMLAAIMPSSTRARGKGQAQALEALRLLKSAGADPNNAVTKSATALHLIHTHGMSEARVRGSTALMMATVQGWTDVMKQLIDWGVNPDAIDADGLSALDYALGRSRVGFLQQRPDPRKDVADALRKLGAKVDHPDIPPWPPLSVPAIRPVVPYSDT